MMRRGVFAGLTTAAAALSAACSPLTAFNSLAPRDPARRLGRAIAYGPLSRQKLDVYAPSSIVRGSKRAPVLVFFYGGSWNSGRRQDYAFVGQALAARGFVTVVPDYRLFPQVRYPEFLKDCAAAVRWTRDQAADYGGDPDRLVLAGHSAGAYNAMMLALSPEFLTAAGVDPKTIKAVAGLSGPYYFLPFDVPSTRDSFGAYADPPATQPLNHVSAASPPAFLAHGGKDTLVQPRNAFALGKALARAGRPVEVKIYPGLGHADTVLALSRPFRGKAPVLSDMAAFLHAHADAPAASSQGVNVNAAQVSVSAD
jgi:acetyl esterase/lipase